MNADLRKWIAGLMACLLLLGSGGTVLAAGQNGGHAYSEYAAVHTQESRPQEEIRIRGTEYSRADDAALTVVDCAGVPGLATGDNGFVEWRFDAPAAGLYNMEISYYPLSGKGNAIQRVLYINDEVPFDELSSVSFPRVYTDAGSEKRYDAAGNELRPEQVEVFRVEKHTLCGSEYNAGEAVSISLKAGENTVAMRGVAEPMAVCEIRFHQKQPEPSYAEASAAYTFPVAEEPIRLEGEAATYRSDKSLYAVCDRSSGQSSPMALGKTVLNAVGGSNWKEPLQYIEWEFTVPRDGLYQLVIRGKQDITPGQISSRRLYIDGEVPFAEARELSFPYGLGFRNFVPGKDGTAYRFALTAGRHTLRLENTVGAIGSLLEKLDGLVGELNSVYTRVFRITGSYPDADRDYNIEASLPGLTDDLQRIYDKLEEYQSEYLSLTGEKGDGYANMDRMHVQLKSVLKDVETLPAKLDTFRANISNLAAWLLTAVAQPLLIDWLEWQPADRAPQAADAGFFGRLWFAMRSFVNSFISDYDTAGAGSGEQETVTVWLGSGRDQMQALNQVVLTDFVRSRGVGVNIRLVDINVLLPAVAAGQGPDVAVGLERSLPLNYAYRGAVQELSSFPGFAELTAQFPQQALTEFTYGNAVYALPDKYTFYMMFYRQDILDELHATAPETWAQLFTLLPRLQTQHMTVGLPNLADNVIDVFTTLLYQRGGRVYDESLSRCLLDSDESLAAFKSFTDFYTKYKVLQKIDALSYFRTGQTPITLQPYTFYASLEASAPEIQGRWDFAPMPGTVQADGSVDYTTSGTATGCCIFSNSNHKDAAWEFLQWFLSAQTQAAYGNELETIQGTAGRYATANRAALQQLPWTNAQLSAILRQSESTQAMPEAPGGYMTGRYIISAATTVINNGLLPRDTLMDYTKNINDEVSAMRRKLGLTGEGA